GTRFAETIRASGLVHRVNRPDTRPLLKPRTSHQKCLAMQEPSTQDKADEADRSDVPVRRPSKARNYSRHDSAMSQSRCSMLQGT
ncbi:MAG: hypothetical protein AAF681_10920, partial [Pseudomonadota bacterium]